MNLSEFKAWFEGFTENLEGPPKEKAWKRIKEKIGKIADTPPTSYPIFVKDYYNPWRRWYPYGPDWYCGSGIAMASENTSHTISDNMQTAASNTMPQLSGGTFDTGSAFKDLGRAEAASLSR